MSLHTFRDWRIIFDILLKARDCVFDESSAEGMRFAGCRIAEHLMEAGNTLADCESLVPGLDKRLRNAMADRMIDLTQMIDQHVTRQPLPIQGLFISGPAGIGKSSTVKRILGVIRRLYGPYSVYEKQSVGKSFCNGMRPGVRIIVFDEYNPTEDYSLTDILRLISCHDSVLFNSKGGYVEQNDLAGVIVVSNHSLYELYNRLRKPIIKWEALKRRFLQIDLEKPTEDLLAQLRVPPHMFTEYAVGELISDWICDAVKAPA